MKRSNEECHRIMWGELHITGDKYKTSTKHLFSEYEWDRAQYGTTCFACAEFARGNYRNCKYCPINWGVVRGKFEVDPPCTCPGSPYHEWLHAKSVEERKKWAGVIAEMKWEVRGGKK